MPKAEKPAAPSIQESQKPLRWQDQFKGTRWTANDKTAGEIDVGRRLRELRLQHHLSIRSLAEQSSLNFNTLSLIENGKSSPSVSTLQQLAKGLGVPITAFFEMDIPRSPISFLKAGQRRRAAFAHGTMEDLGGGLTIRG